MELTQIGHKISSVFVISVGLTLSDRVDGAARAMWNGKREMDGGRMSVVHQHTSSAMALEDTTLIVLSRRALYQLHQEDIALFALLMMNLARELARRLHFMDKLLLASVHTHANAETSGS